MKTLLNITLLCMSVFLFACSDSNSPEGDSSTKTEVFAPVAVQKKTTTKIWMHYMPWFETPTSNNGNWGMHWTMSTRNPNTIDNSGKREIAAHYYPLIGPYASSDVDVLEYHFLLMKYAGVDGILIDWYGTRKINDYDSNRKNTEIIVDILEKVGLDFAIVYEDRTLEEGLEEDSRLSQAREDMIYLQNNFFSKSNYIKVNDKPLLLVFGPIVMKTPVEWNRMLAGFAVKPNVFPIFYFMNMVNDSKFTNGTGGYIWVDENEISIKDKYDNQSKYGTLIGTGYPGFKDYYREGGWGDAAGAIVDPENGALLQRLLDMAAQSNMKYLQLCTWNDFGEGTMIEPTLEFGYTFLEKVQHFAKVDYNVSNLEDIHTYYLLKQKYKDDVDASRKLLQAYYYLISLQSEKAREILNNL